MKLGNADYAGQDPAAARADFIERVRKYAAVYEEVTEDELSFIQTINLGRLVVLNRINGYLMSQVATIVFNMHVDARFVFLTRHGQSEDNAAGRLGVLCYYFESYVPSCVCAHCCMRSFFSLWVPV